MCVCVCTFLNTRVKVLHRYYCVVVAVIIVMCTRRGDHHHCLRGSRQKREVKINHIIYITIPASYRRTHRYSFTHTDANIMRLHFTRCEKSHIIIFFFSTTLWRRCGSYLIFISLGDMPCSRGTRACHCLTCICEHKAAPDVLSGSDRNRISPAKHSWGRWGYTVRAAGYRDTLFPRRILLRSRA